MRHILAFPDRQWRGFRPIAYVLDEDKVASLALVRINGTEQQPTTGSEVLQSLRDCRIESVEDGVWETEIKTDRGTFLLKGDSFNRKLLEVLLNLQKDGTDNLFATRWFWFDEDYCLTDIQESYSFFVVSGSKLVREHITFYDSPGDGFDPSVFVAGNPFTLGFWRRERDWGEAYVRYWYRYFYKETQTGQLMVLRPDEPKLHYLTRLSEPGFSIPIQNMLKPTPSILLLVLIVAVIVAVILLRR